MKTIDWERTDEDRSTPTTIGNRFTYSARRVHVGHCPDCGNVLVVFNDGESWPLVGCACGWQGDVPSVRDGLLFADGFVTPVHR